MELWENRKQESREYQQRKPETSLYTAAWESWAELIGEQCPDGQTGAVLALHSAGSLLHFHSHIHGLFLSGATKADGSFVPVPVSQEKLLALFGKKVLQAL